MPMPPEPDRDDATLERAVNAGDPTVMLAALLQMTDDAELAALRTHPLPFMGAFLMRVLSAEGEALVRRKAVAFLRNPASPPPPPARDRLTQIMSVFSGGEFPESYVGPALEELALEPNPRRVEWEHKPAAEALEASSVLVIGTGLAGIAAAIQAKKLGLNVTVIEKNPDVGGTWHENRYPDARVDVPSHHYSFTFEVGYGWKHFFAPQAEIAQYIRETAQKHGVYDVIEFNLEAVALTWDEAAAQWEVRCRRSDGAEETRRARFVISAVGMLNRPRDPDIAGLDEFRGRAFHTSRWDTSLDLKGLRVGLLGTGASGLQLAPRVAETAAELTVFQRTPQWMAPIPGYRSEIPQEVLWLLAHFPYYQNWLRMKLFYSYCDKADELYDVDPDWRGDANAVNARTEAAVAIFTAHLRDQLGGRPDLLEKCTPKYPPMARRIVVDNGWLAALTRPNVKLVTDPIERVTPAGVRTVDGVEHALDVLVLASGFHANRYLWPMEITGRGDVTLAAQWSHDGPRAYLGITMPNFPNLFCLYGPNTNPKSGSPCMWGEVQARYSLDCIRRVCELGLSSLEVKASVHDDYNHRLDQRLRRAIWADTRAVSYYRNEFGRVGTNMPWLADEYWAMTRTPILTDFQVA